MIRSSSRIIAGLASVIAVMLIGPAVGSAVAAELTLDASKKQIVRGKSIKLSGTLSDTFMGANNGRTVTLMATEYPYDVEQVVTTTTTGQNGDYSFGKIKPDLNTRYRATFEGNPLEGSAESPSRQIFVFARTSFDVDVVRTTARASFAFRYSPKVQPEYYVGRRDLNWYFRKTTQNKFKRIDQTKFKNTSDGAKGNLSYRLPRSRNGYRFIITVCVDAPAQDIGIGNDKPLMCPKSFRARGANRTVARVVGP